MTFARADYLDWYIPRMRRGDAAINLHASGVASLDGRYMEGLSGNPWESVPALESGLAQTLGLPADELLFTPGATGGTLLALLTLGRPGSTVLAESPLYEPMWRQADRLNRLERFSRRPENGWRLPLNEVHERLHSAVSVVMITEPHNPSGVLSPRKDVLELADMAGEVGATLLINEVYRGYSDTPSYHGLARNILVVSSLSKYVGAYWMRLGWLSGSPDLIKLLRSGHLNLGMATLPAAMAGLKLLPDLPALGANARALATAGCRVVDDWIAQTPGLRWHCPMGPGFGAVELPPLVNDVTFAEHLHDTCGLLVVPGHCFDAPGTLRLSWLQCGDRLQEGLAIIARELPAFAA